MLCLLEPGLEVLVSALNVYNTPRNIFRSMGIGSQTFKASGSASLTSPVKSRSPATVSTGVARPWVVSEDSGKCLFNIIVDNITHVISKVPIFDSRDPVKAKHGASGSDRNVTPTFSMNRHDLSQLHRTLNKYPDNRDIPSGSLALVAYTVGSYEKNGMTVFSPTLNWVVVIAAND